ncbi:MAG: hypothetical protein ACP5XB_25235 [Isosphaeraceae bacterium]
MNEIERLRQFDHPAETSPQVDVADWVIRDIQARGPTRHEPLLAILTALGSSAALTVTYLAFEMWSILQDPLGAFLDSWSMVLR